MTRCGSTMASGTKVLLIVLERIVTKAGRSSSLSAHTQLRRAQTGENVRFDRDEHEICYVCMKNECITSFPRTAFDGNPSTHHIYVMCERGKLRFKVYSLV